MLRAAFVYLIMLGLLPGALKGPVGALQLYLWEAYFRPAEWAYGAMGALNVSLYAGIYVLIRTLAAGTRFRMNLRTVLLFAFVMLALVSTLNTEQVNVSWERSFLDRWGDFAKAITMSYLLSVIVDDIPKVRIVLSTIALSLSFEGAKQGWAQLLLNPGGINTNTLPQLGDNNGVALGMVMLLAVVLALAQTSTKRWERWMYRMLVVGVAFRAVSTYSRGAFLALATLALVYFLLSKQRIRVAVGLTVLLGAIFMVVPESYWNRMSTIGLVAQDEVGVEIEGLVDEGNMSVEGRLHFWQVAVEMANDRPILGVGFTAYQTAYDDYDFSRGLHGSRRAVHSSWLGTLSELGYTGLAVYVSMLLLAVSAAWRAMRMAKRGDLPPEGYHCALAIQAALIAGAFGSSFLTWQYTEMLWHFIGLGMALHNIAATAAARALKAGPSAETANIDYEPESARQTA